MTCSCFPSRWGFFLQWSTLAFWSLGLAAEGRLPTAPRMWCSLEIRPNILCVSASDLIRRCGRA
jgi:hypothetical protein